MQAAEKDCIEWEYLVLNCKGQSDAKDQLAMNELGKDGWELVSMSEGVAYFKRLIK